MSPPGPKDTPPASPSFIRDPMEEVEDEDEVLNEEDVLEVIDLDEELEDEEDDEGNMDEEEDGAVGGGPLKPQPEDNSIRDLDEHGGKSVFTCDIHPNYSENPLVVTGGEDDRALVINGQTGDIVMRCENCFKDSVTQAKFNHDGTFLAVADMSGVVKVWKMATKETVWEFETSDITWLGWHCGANVLFVTTVDSELWMWKIPSGESKVFAGHGEKAECGQLLHDGRKFLVGYSDGTMRLFDLKTGDTVHNLTGMSAHNSAVSSLACKDDNHLIASGGVDGIAKLFNVQSGKTLGTFACSKSAATAAISKHEGASGETETATESNAGVEAMIFSKSELNLLLTGTLEGTIYVWDLSTQVSRQTISVGTGVVKMEWRNGSNHEILVGTLDGLVRVVDVKKGTIVADCSGHTEAILDFSQSKDGKTIVTSSDDGHSKIYDIDKIMEST